jgi:hypothetical protein
MDQESFRGHIKRGREFETQERSEWAASVDEALAFEVPTRWRGRRGRIDIRLGEAAGDRVVVVELKGSDWDRMAGYRVRPNALRHACQLWKYINAELLQGKAIPSFDGVLPAIVYPVKPRAEGRSEQGERILHERGIQVVWRS